MIINTLAEFTTLRFRYDVLFLCHKIITKSAKIDNSIFEETENNPIKI
jgi:hypothetical protein